MWFLGKNWTWYSLTWRHDAQKSQCMSIDITTSTQYKIPKILRRQWKIYVQIYCFWASSKLSHRHIYDKNIGFRFAIFMGKSA